jgi:hypothetical protein
MPDLVERLNRTTMPAAGAKVAANPFGTRPDDAMGTDPGRAQDDAAARLVAAWRDRGLDGTVRLVRGEMPAAGACAVALCDQLGPVDAPPGATASTS